jgi:hypothetical protein
LGIIVRRCVPFAFAESVATQPAPRNGRPTTSGAARDTAVSALAVVRAVAPELQAVVSISWCRDSGSGRLSSRVRK